MAKQTNVKYAIVITNFGSYKPLNKQQHLTQRWVTLEGVTKRFERLKEIIDRKNAMGGNYVIEVINVYTKETVIAG